MLDLPNFRMNFRMDFEDINDCFELVKNLTIDTAAEPYILSILQHMLFIRDDHLIRYVHKFIHNCKYEVSMIIIEYSTLWLSFFRPAYYKLIEECVTQIVLHKNGCDPDFRATARFKIDVQPLIDGLIGEN